MSDDGEGRQVFLLTGCASGIGAFLARRLIEKGHQVVCTDVNQPGMQRWLSTCEGAPERSLCRLLDVRKPRAWDEVMEQAIEAFGQVDVVMNIAGFLRPGYAGGVTDEDVDLHLDINVKGVIYGTRAAAHHMSQRGCGHIINIGSLASLTPVPGLGLYAASKFAVRGYSLSVAEDLRPHGIAVSVVLLDAVKTPMLDLQADYEEAALTFSGPRPLTLEEVEHLIMDDVLIKRPLEVTLPRSRGMIARVAGVAPELTKVLGPLLTRLGRRAQAKYEA